MITLKLQGGLGNQMFIYAFAKTLEHMGYDVCLDARIYNFYRQKSHDIETNRRGGGYIQNHICLYASLNCSISISHCPSSIIHLNGCKMIR